MGRKCAVLNCLSDSQRSEDLGVTFHKIPAHTDIKPKWLELCKIVEDRKSLYVCSRHFLRADFCNFRGKKYVLKQGVLPSIFSWNKQKPISNIIEKSATEKVEVSPDKSETNKNLDMDMSKNVINEVIEANIAQPLHIKTEPVDIKEEIISPTDQVDIEQKMNSGPSSSSNFTANMRIEALDFNQTWCPATILEVDYEENEVLVHFDTYNNKYDEWIGINSSSIRTIPAEGFKKQEVFAEGDRCMASWSDARKFPATITKVIDDTTYEVLFDDGYVKTLKVHRISKCSTTSPQKSPLFQPIRSTKEDRRNRKRKINVSKLFKKKKAGGTTREMEDLSAGSWFPTWIDGHPVGTESELMMQDGIRKSVIVPDPNLPPKWEKHLAQRTTGTLAGKWDVIIISPEGRRFRLKSEVKQYIEENPELNLTEFMFTFALSNRRIKKVLKPPINLESASTSFAGEISKSEPQLSDCLSLKILQIDGGYKCPIEGCGKNFRRENLAQMHVKHYHPKYTKFLDSTPNVADLAYARTVGENLDRSPGSERMKENRVSKVKNIAPKMFLKPNDEEGTQPSSSIDRKESMKDLEIIKLLNSKPFDAIKSTESSSTEPLPSGLPPSMYPDIKLKDLLNKSEAVPKGADLNLKSLSSSTTRPTGLKTLLPVRKEENLVPNVKQLVQKRDPKKKKLPMENVDTLESKDALKYEPISAPLEIPPLPPVEGNDIIIEGGEIIKIVRMKQEEIINCTCGITEEDGLMIQCELCLCWQHAYCNNIQKENEVPDKYICYICQNPVRQRNSKKYIHDQDWLKHGTLPSASFHSKDEEAQSERFEKLKMSHDISGGLLELKDFMHSVKLKIKIAEAKNHPKLYLWSKAWEKEPLPEKLDIKLEKPETSNNYNKLEANSGETMLMTLLKSKKEETKMNQDIPEFPKIDINTIIDNNLEEMSSNIPQPEAAIESSDCRLNLLDHISHCQNLIEERLNNFEKQIDELDSTLVDDNDENYDKIRQATSMLLRDLGTMKELSQTTSF